MEHISWIPIILSGVGAVISFTAVIFVAIIGFLVRYVLANFEHRVRMLEQKAEKYAEHMASSTTQTQAETDALKELRGELGSVRERLDNMERGIAELTGLLRAQSITRMPDHD